MTNNIQGNLHQAIGSFLNRKLYKADGNGMMYLKWWQRRTYNQESSTQQASPSDLMEKSKLSRQAKATRTQHHQTSFTTNAKGTSPGRKHSRRSTENKPQTTEKQVTGAYISIITLNVNGLNAPNKTHGLAGPMETRAACMHCHSPHHSGPPKLFTVILHR